MDENKFIPLYSEHLHFLVARAGGLLTKIYEHYTFEQAKHKAISSVEKDFYKLLNNANFEIDCRDNIYNCVFKPIYDEIGEIGYMKNMTVYLIIKNIIRHNSNEGGNWRKKFQTFPCRKTTRSNI